MTWSYSGDPSDSTLDAVRFLCGDTDTTDQLLNNEEVSFLILGQPSEFNAAADACEAIASKFARKIDRNAIGLSAALSQKVRHYEGRAERLRRMATRDLEIFVGGLSISDKDALFDNADATQPSFSIGQDDGTTVDEQQRRHPHHSLWHE